MSAGVGRPSRRAAGTALVLALALAAMPGRADAPPACLPPPTLTGEIAAFDGLDLRLTDGRILRLPDVRPAPGGRLPAVAGQRVRLHGAGPPDRWGRLPVAGITLLDGAGAGMWLEGALVSSGAALVAPQAGAVCLPELLAREAAARAAKAGLWADPAAQPIAADDLQRLGALVGRYVLVEGRVRGVGERANTVYLNFGHHWREDFTVTLRARDARQLGADPQGVSRLAGRVVRVRGYVQLRGGPLIEAVPAAVEVVR